MKGLGILAAGVLLLMPAAALYRDGSFARAAAEPVATQTVFETPVIPATAPVTPMPPGIVPPKPVPPARDVMQAVKTAMADFPGQYSVVVQDLQSGQRWTLNETQRYHPASTIKMPVSLYALAQYRSGKLGWQDLITYTEADYESPGGGAFETAPFGGQYTVENLVGRALQYSNNVAVNMLGRHLGWENIRAWSRTINGELYREADASPSVTAISELGWWLHLEQLSHQDPKAAELLLQPLRSVAYDGRIGAGVPKGVPYLHKFGSYNKYYHDGGIIYGDHPFVLIVLTHGASESQADEAIAHVAQAVYAEMAH